MSQPLMKKLALKPGFRATLLNTSPAYEQVLRAELNEITFELVSEGMCDFVLLFVHDTRELTDWLAKATQAIDYNGLLWIAYPKKSAKINSDIHRDILRETMESQGYSSVTLISLDETWSIMRFRPAELVKPK